MIELEYSLIIEATKEPDCFGFYSTDLDSSEWRVWSTEKRNSKRMY